MKGIYGYRMDMIQSRHVLLLLIWRILGICNVYMYSTQLYIKDLRALKGRYCVYENFDFKLMKEEPILTDRGEILHSICFVTKSEQMSCRTYLTDFKIFFMVFFKKNNNIHPS